MNNFVVKIRNVFIKDCILFGFSEMIGVFKRLGVVVLVVIRKFLNFIDLQSFSVSFIYNYIFFGYISVSQVDFFFMTVIFNVFRVLGFGNGGGVKCESY